MDNPTLPATPVVETRRSMVLRFCGDSGDGMQLSGGQFTSTTALFGNDIATFPDFPAEIRAPRGTTFGVSGFQIQFASEEIYTPGDRVDALVAMNPAALRVNLGDVEPGGIVVVDQDEFTSVNLRKCGYPEGYDPLEDEALRTRYRFVPVPMTRLVRESLAGDGKGAKDIDRCRNMYALGLAYWLFDRPLDPTIDHIHRVFDKGRKRPDLAEMNIQALRAGFNFGETTELFPVRYEVPPARLAPGRYRRISGNEALSLGLVVAAAKAGKGLFYAGYPITPASEIIHQLALLKHVDVRTFQAEDEIAAVCAAIGAAFAGDFAAAGTSGPGLALKAEGLGLAVMLELPLVVVDVQRAGPSTGMPTKTEQADLLQAMFGRHGESPCLVLAPATPSDCFAIAIEAFRLAVRCMCPAIILSDGFIANGAEPWLIPDIRSIPPIEVKHPASSNNPDGPFLPYLRDPRTLGRPWAVPGTPGLEHRIGGLEKQDRTGEISYDPENHDRMVRLRAEKIARAAEIVAPLEVRGPQSGEALLLGWGGTYGAITTAADALREEGLEVGSAHLRHLNPFPPNLGEVLGRFRRIIVPEINLGQLLMLVRARHLVDAVGVNQVRGRTFRVEELKSEVRRILGR